MSTCFAELAPVKKSLMEKAGFKDRCSSNRLASVLVTRSAKKNKPNAGGSAFVPYSSWVTADVFKSRLRFSVSESNLLEGNVRLAMRSGNGKAA